MVIKVRYSNGEQGKRRPVTYRTRPVGLQESCLYLVTETREAIALRVALVGDSAFKGLVQVK